MADPTGYSVSYSFSSFQASAPTTPLPAPKLDTELANIAAAIATLVSAIESVRRADGALQNKIVTFDSLEDGLQFMLDPTNGQLVAAAVASAQAAATTAAGSSATAGTSATAAAASAAAAAASASGVNLSLYLAKANNLAGLGSNTTALSNIGAMDAGASTAVGRLAPFASTTPITDWNTAVSSGWYHGFGASNQPSYNSQSDWLAEVIAHSALWVTQIAYPFSLGTTSTSAVVPFRRQGYNNSGTIAWQPWESMATLPVGSTIWVNGTSAPSGFVKENGALLSRASFPALYTYAAASGNIVSEATWTASSWGSFSTGDLSTTFRLPDSRGEFIRGYDDSRGVDSGRSIGTRQADALKDHTHQATAAHASAGQWNPGGGASPGVTTADSAQTTGGSSLGAATETRPRNVAKLACIKF